MHCPFSVSQYYRRRRWCSDGVFLGLFLALSIKMVILGIFCILGPSWQTGFFESALTDKNMYVTFCLNLFSKIFFAWFQMIHSRHFIKTGFTGKISQISGFQNLLKKILLAYFYLSKMIQKNQFAMTDPVF
jgi:hypothetical protein